MNRPRGTPTITSREPLAVAVATGRKSDRGFPVDTHRFFLVNSRADGKGQAAVRRMHPSFERFNAIQPSAKDVSDFGPEEAKARHDAARQTIRGVIVHASEEEAFWTNYRAQTLPGHEHPKQAPSCEGDGVRAKRWMPSQGAYADIECPADKCRYRQPSTGARGPTRPPCNPYACLVFQLRFENAPCLPAKYETRGHEANGNLKGFFDNIKKQAAHLGLTNPSLYGLPFVLDLSRRSDGGKQTKWFVASMSPDFPPGMTLQQFLLRQSEERAQLVSRAPLLIGTVPTVGEVMDAEYKDAGSIGGER